MLDRAFAVKYTVASYNGVQRLNCTKLSRGSRQEQTRLSVLSEKSATASEAVRRRWKPSSSSSSFPPGLCFPPVIPVTPFSSSRLRSPRETPPLHANPPPFFYQLSLIKIRSRARSANMRIKSTRRSRSRERKHHADRTCRWIDGRNVPSRGAALKSAVNINVHPGIYSVLGEDEHVRPLDPRWKSPTFRVYTFRGRPYADPGRADFLKYPSTKGGRGGRARSCSRDFIIARPQFF